ncbi:MAG TPA: glutaredoxin family protein [Coriobacteriia bacterium]|nr:glutaredoxin family protein [Coriobacteriia bacterium]
MSTAPLGDASDIEAADEASGLVVYCRSWCPDCRRAKQWLDDHGIPYQEVDVDTDVEGRERAAGLNEGRLHTPTFEKGDEVCIDFKPNRIKEILEMP